MSQQPGDAIRGDDAKLVAMSIIAFVLVYCPFVCADVPASGTAIFSLVITIVGSGGRAGLLLLLGLLDDDSTTARVDARTTLAQPALLVVIAIQGGDTPWQQR